MSGFFFEKFLPKHPDHFQNLGLMGTRLFVPFSDFSYRSRNSTATNENGVKNNIKKPKRRQIETATYILL